MISNQDFLKYLAYLCIFLHRFSIFYAYFLVIPDFS